MKRMVSISAAVLLLTVLLVPTALAAAPGSRTGSLLLAVDRSVEIPTGDHLDTLVVIDGNAIVSGDIPRIIVVSGHATLTGATSQTVWVVNGSADLQAGTTVSGDVRTLRGTVTQQPGSTVGGSVRSLDADLVAMGILLFGMFVVLMLGLALAAVAAALMVAALGARQVREAEALISHQPGQVLVAGIAGAVLLPLLALVLMITVVGAPIGIAMLLVLLPVTFLAWVVAAIWIGDWIVARLRGAPEPDRPYRAAVLGVVGLAILGILPFVTAIATLFGFGALVLAAWRMLRREAPPSGEAGAVPVVPSAA